ncbi:MAG: hypothetical protein GYA34_16605 [Chloroflexi bacterium]|nr:hypothetical protein [Chloroflexota bacterium]
MNGKNTNPGTATLPWGTIQKCLDEVNPGDTCTIMGGTYYEALTLKTSGTETSRIILRNYEDQIVTIDSGKNKTLVTNGRVGYYTIEGLRFIASYTSAGQGDYTIDLKMTLWDGETNKDGGNNGFMIRDCYIEGAIKFYGHNNIVENCELNGKQNWSNGINDEYATSHDNLYRGNVIHDYKKRGVWTMQYTENILIEGNTIYNSGNMGIDCDGAGNPVRRCMVKSNQIYDISGEGVGVLLENAFDSIAEANEIYRVKQGIGIINYGPPIIQEEYRTTDSHTIIRNNVIHNTSQDGIICKGSPGGKALNNTIYDTRQTPGYWAGIGLTGYEGYYCHNWEIKNNLISQASKYAIWYDSPTDGLHNLSSDYNLFDFEPNEERFIWIVYSETEEDWNPYNLSQIQKQKQLEKHSILGKSMFLNETMGDFHLQENSPAINTGYYVGVTADFDGVQRPQGSGYDIGAFEFID